MFADRFFHPEDFDIVDTVEAIAKEKDVKPAQVALSWLLHKGVTAPIIGATKVEHVEDAVGAVGVKLSSDDMKRLEEKYHIHPILGHS
jgi:aryl-alcohol dehydrogenase (NADP+)